MNEPDEIGVIMTDLLVGRISTLEARDKLLSLISEEKIKEWQLLSTAKINYSASPAPFNPYGMPISTPETKEMTRLLQQYAKDRINQLTNGDK